MNLESAIIIAICFVVVFALVVYIIEKAVKCSPEVDIKMQDPAYKTAMDEVLNPEQNKKEVIFTYADVIRRRTKATLEKQHTAHKNIIESIKKEILNRLPIIWDDISIKIANAAMDGETHIYYTLDSSILNIIQHNKACTVNVEEINYILKDILDTIKGKGFNVFISNMYLLSVVDNIYITENFLKDHELFISWSDKECI